MPSGSRSRPGAAGRQSQRSAANWLRATRARIIAATEPPAAKGAVRRPAKLHGRPAVSVRCLVPGGWWAERISRRPAAFRSGRRTQTGVGRRTLVTMRPAGLNKYRVGSRNQILLSGRPGFKYRSGPEFNIILNVSNCQRLPAAANRTTFHLYGSSCC
jgi:hypothetical protein